MVKKPEEFVNEVTLLRDLKPDGAESFSSGNYLVIGTALEGLPYKGGMKTLSRSWEATGN